MKNLFLFVFTIGFILTSGTSFAQFGNQGFGNGMNGGGNGMGGNGGMNIPQSEPDKPVEIPAEVTAKKSVESLKPILNLDELQVIAIEGVITKSLRAQGVILKKGNSDEEKLEDMKVISETNDRKILEFLNKDQKVKYQALIDEKRR
jgi:hypothetical protein